MMLFLNYVLASYAMACLLVVSISRFHGRRSLDRNHFIILAFAPLTMPIVLYFMADFLVSGGGRT